MRQDNSSQLQGAIPCRTAEWYLFDADHLLLSRVEVCLEIIDSYIAMQSLAGSAKPRHAMLAMPCSALLCYAMLCYAMLCYAMLCYAMLDSTRLDSTRLNSTQLNSTQLSTIYGSVKFLLYQIEAGSHVPYNAVYKCKAQRQLPGGPFSHHKSNL